MNKTRSVAFKIIFQCLFKDGYSNKLLNKYREKNEFIKKDLNFINLLTIGVIKNYVYLKWLISSSEITINFNKTNKQLIVIFCMAIYEKIFLNIPVFAIVNEYVNVVKNFDKSKTGFINKCLKIILNTLDESKLDTNLEENFCIRYSFDNKIFNKIKKDFSLKIAKEIAINSCEKSKLFFRYNLSNEDYENFINDNKTLFNIEKSNIANKSFSANSDIIHSSFFEEGIATIQDPTSTLAVEMLGIEHNAKILDMCSAPGGKLTHIAKVAGSDSDITGCDISENKLSLVRENLKRLKISNIKLVCSDALDLDEDKYNYILLDAPCSGFGVLKRKPEIKYKNDVDKLVSALSLIQQKLLEKAYKLLDENGILVYSTCTIFKEENEYNVKTFLENHLNLELIWSKQFFGTEEGNDGFYIAKIKKINI